jgi:hypothetical protein
MRTLLATRTSLFLSSLFLLAAVAFIFPRFIWLAVVGAIVATGVWIYFLLRDTEIGRQSVPTQPEDDAR